MKQMMKRGLALVLVMLLCLSMGDGLALAEGLEALYAQVFAQAETVEEAMDLGESLGLGGSASDTAPAFKLLRPEEDDSRIELLAPASDEGVQATGTAVDVNSVTWSNGPGKLGFGYTSTVKWGITTDGTLVIYPSNGISGTCELLNKAFNSSPWFNYTSSIKKVVVNPGVVVSGSAKYLFYGLNKVTNMDLSGMHTQNVTDMTVMFKECSALTSLDLSSFDTTNVTNMSGMFYQCKALTSLNLSNFNTANVTDMSYMFYECNALTSLDLSHFSTSNVTNMESMFIYCHALTSLDVSSFSTSKVTNMNGMFYQCKALTSLDLSGFNTANVTDKNNSQMFYQCAVLREIKLGKNFSFKDTNYGTLNTPYTATGKWIREDGAYGPYTPYQLAIAFNANPAALAGTWVWEMPSYTLRFDSKGGTGEMANLKAAPGESLTLPPCAFINDGYDFLGWARSSTATAPDYADGATLPTGYPNAQHNQTYTLYALWKVATTYTLQLADGSGASLTLGTYEAAQDAAIVTTGEEFSRLGYTLAGWKDENTGAEYGLSFTIQAGTYAAGTRPVLTAIWRKNIPETAYGVEHYQQKEDLSGYTMTESETFTTTVELSYTPAVKSYPGFLSPAEQTITVTENGENIVKYYYDREYYTVVFSPNGGTGAMEPLACLFGRSYALPYNAFERENCFFTGWNTAADGSGTSYGDHQTISGLASEHGATVTLYARWKDAAGNTLAPSEGEITVQCRAGEIVILPTLPAGTRYEIEEVELPAGWSQKAASGLSGAVSAGGRSEASVTNGYAATGSTTLRVSCQMSNAPLSAGQFDFQVLDGNGAVIANAANGLPDTAETLLVDGAEQPNPDFGKAPVVFPALSFDAEGVYTYTITEVNGGDPAVEYDGHTVTARVTVVDQGGGVLGCTVSYEPDTTFVNRMLPGSLRVSTTVENGSQDHEFTYTLNLTDSAGEALGGSYTWTKSDGSSGTIANGESFTLKHGETITVTGLPNGTLYSVSEEPGGGYTVSTEGASGTISANATAEASFSNRYSSGTYSSGGSLTVSGRTVLVGGELKADTFAFQLLNGDKSEVLQTVYADADGTIRFTAIDYDLNTPGLEDGEESFTYFVRQVPGDEPNVDYDTELEQIRVHVKDMGDGTMKIGKLLDASGNWYEGAGATWSEGIYYVSDSDAGEILFTNVKRYPLTISNTVSGPMGSRTKEFEFTLTLTGSDETLTAPANAIGWTNLGGGVYGFRLRDGDTIEMLLPSGVSYTVTVTDAEIDPYRTSYVVTVGGSAGESTEGRSVSGTLTTASHAVAFTNNRGMPPVPTGTGIAASGGLLLVVAAVGLSLLFVPKKKRRGA